MTCSRCWACWTASCRCATSMSFLIGADGSVAESKLEKSSGFKGLDKAAIKSLSACKFKPGSKDGAPAQTWTKVDYAWKLD